MDGNHTQSFEKVSLTAVFVAYWRQYTDIQFAQDVADLIRANEKVEHFLRSHQITRKEVRWYAPLFEIRHKSIQEAIRLKGMTQVLEVASGLSFRGLSMAQHPGMKYVETDLKDLTNEKRAIVDALKKKYSLTVDGNFSLAAANALNAAELQLAADFFDSRKQTAVVTEGLLMYLTTSEMEIVARNIKAVLEKSGGIWITPDFSLKENYDDVSPQRLQVRDAIAELTGRQLHKNIFDSRDHLASFLGGIGLRAEALRQTDLVSRIVSLSALKLPARFLEKVKPKLNLWIISLS
ncbi:MAG TPA: class I SAM-dependent methyltransferase [Bacteroidota bacterium]|nr:class I SAM-dependent methyltransferase [Bacteroidota bacterium]